ncbi:MAG: OmpA family protein [Flavobacterium sp.]|nr:OmpA family protein [Pedobacter sp.]
MLSVSIIQRKAAININSKQILSFCFCFLFCINISRSQGINEFSGDLASAKKIQVNSTYKFELAPMGFGLVQEYKLNKSRSANLFKEERNTAWYSIDIPFGGIFTFDITPHGIKDDYDWMLYKQTSPATIDWAKLPLIRTNNTRNNKDQGSKTGLLATSESLFTKPGPGNSYSKALNVKKGDKLILVVDNIYKKGKGFDLVLVLKPNCQTKTLVEGIIRDKKTNKPLKAEVTFQDDSTGFVFAKINSDDNGYYKTSLPVDRRINSLAKRLGYLLVTDNFTVITSEKPFKQDFYLDTIVQGKKMDLMNIHFSPNKAEFLESSQSELANLLTFLNEQPEWQIKIVGHTNNNVFANTRFLQQLSFERALAVKRYLLKNAISEQRMSCVGAGGKDPIVTTNDPDEGKRNMRVEVVLMKKQ